MGRYARGAQQITKTTPLQHDNGKLGVQASEEKNHHNFSLLSLSRRALSLFGSVGKGRLGGKRRTLHSHRSRVYIDIGVMSDFSICTHKSRLYSGGLFRGLGTPTSVTALLVVGGDFVK